MKNQWIIKAFYLIILPVFLLGSRVDAKTVAELETEKAKLQKEIDGQLQWYFRYQVQAGWYRTRLQLLQEEWQKLLGNLIPNKKSYPPAPMSSFRVDEVFISDAQSLRQGVLAPRCKRKSDCRLYLRISFSAVLAKSSSSFTVTASMKNTSRKDKQYTLRPEQGNTREKVAILAIPLSSAGKYIWSGPYIMTVRIMAGGRYVTKTLNFNLGLK